MGNSANNARTKTNQMQAEQVQASKMELPNPSGAQLASFNAKKPFELVKFDKGTSAKDSGFTFKQDGVTFGAGTFDSQYGAVSQFDPNKAYTLGGKGDTPIITQGNLTFTIPNPVALTDPTNASSISPNGGSSSTASDATNVNALARTPRNVKTGALLSTASARAVSGSSFNKTRSVGLRRPMLAGY